MKISVITSLYNCSLFLEKYFIFLLDIKNLNEIEVLLIHNAPTKDELAIVEKYKLYTFIKHFIVEKRESLYVSWNRAIRLAQGNYLAIWNVDDVRTPESLLIQSELLDKNPEVAMVYGDFVSVVTYGSQIGERVSTPVFSEKNKQKFLSSCFAGCFPMWRKSIHSKTGYYDEQFKIVGDFEFQARVARNFKLMGTSEILGYYLVGYTGKLSDLHKLHGVENDLIYLRYAGYWKLNLLNIYDVIKKYRINFVKQELNWIAVKLFFPNYFSFKIKRLYTILQAFLMLPYYTLRRIYKNV